MRKMTSCVCLAIVVSLASATAATNPVSEPGNPPENAAPIRLNQIQVIGTHNSYHLRPPARDSQAPAKANNNRAGYEHAPLDVQLDRGVRSFELDLHHMEDGFHVFHMHLVDNRSSCDLFVECLQTVETWSDAHPGHVPISFLLELKDRKQPQVESVLPIDGAALDRLDGKILSVFGRERVLVPDDVRGDTGTLEEAVRSTGWPLLEDVRGKVLFILHEWGANRIRYIKDRPSLEGRMMFVNSRPGNPDAATLVLDHPNINYISPLVKQGYLIRTRADAGLAEGRQGDTTRRDLAFASGSHIVSTDFPAGEAHKTTGYVVRFPEGCAARRNPVNAPGEGGCVEPGAME